MAACVGRPVVKSPIRQMPTLPVFMPRAWPPMTPSPSGF